MKTISAARRSPRALPDILSSLQSAELWEHPGTEVEITGSLAAGLAVRTSAPVPVEQVPEAARRFLPASPRIIQRFELPPVAGAEASVASATQRTEVDSVPVDVHARIDFAAADPADVPGSGTEISVVAEISSTVPLFGAAVESAVAPTVERLLGERLDEIAGL